ncbi:MAG: response regulator transcription factor [Actinomycetota bacterium]
MRNRVLIADDLDFVRDAIRVTLELGGFTVVGEAGDGLSAFTLVFELRPDFLILDYDMPKMDGGTTAELVRATRPDVAIVAFSSVFDGRPWWADAHIRKDGVAGIVPVLEALKPRRIMISDEDDAFVQLTLI